MAQSTSPDPVIDLEYLFTGKKNSNPSVHRYPSENGPIGIYDAARAGNLPVTQLLLLCGEPVNGKEQSGRKGTVLHYAALYDHSTLVQYLLSNNSNVNSINGDNSDNCVYGDELEKGFGQTPLMWACHANQFNTARILLQGGAKPDVQDSAGFTAAFHGSHSPLLLHLLSINQAQLATHRDYKGRYLLHWVAIKGHYFSMVYLFEKANWMDVDCTDSDGSTPLHLAAKAGQVESVKLLVARGADVLSTDIRCKTPLQVASSRRVRALLRKLVSESRTTSELHKSKLLIPQFHMSADKLREGQWKRFALAFFIPNIIMMFASQMPTFLGILFLFGTAVLMFITTMRAAKTHQRDLVTTGWYMGAFCSGSAILVVKVWPVVITGLFYSTVLVAWAVFCCSMLFSYFRVLLGDPGILPSQREHREQLYSLVERGIYPKKGDWCVDGMVKKCNRSKFCTTTKVMVGKFDHYCVWLGNAIGAKNHVYFMSFCFSQYLAQLCVFIFVRGFFVLQLDKISNSLSLCDWLDLLLSTNNSLVTFFLIGYNLMAFIFVSGILFQQIKFLNKGMTTNDVWYPERQSYMARIGGELVSLYDQGFAGNWKEFMSGKLHENEYTCPQASEVAIAKIRKFQEKTGRPVIYGKHGDGPDIPDITADQWTEAATRATDLLERQAAQVGAPSSQIDIIKTQMEQQMKMFQSMSPEQRQALMQQQFLRMRADPSQQQCQSQQCSHNHPSLD